MNAMIGTLAKSPISRLQVRSLCAEWHVSVEKLYQLLWVMESVGLLRIIRKVNDTKAHTVGAKLFFGDPVYYALLEGNSGTMREALVTAMIAEAGYLVEALRDEVKGDFLVNVSKTPRSIEVGGPSKEAKKADFAIRDYTDVWTQKSLPLRSLGFLY
jgi:hypothetical protein